MRRSKIAWTLAVLLGSVVAVGAQTLVQPLWNGEKGDVSAMKFYYGSVNSTQAMAGARCFEGVPDQWHAPGIGLNNLDSWRADLSGYDELWFYAKADAVGKTFSFSVYGWPYTSRKVDITPYMVGGGGLDTTYQLVRIPIDSLKTADYSLNKVEILYFGTAPAGSKYKIYIDEIRAVRLQVQSLWNGEGGDVSAMKFYYGSANSTQAVAGARCFEGVPDQWHAPGIGLNNLSSWRADLSGYDELWFYAKADAVGKTFSFSVYGWPYTSRKVDITPYIVGGGGLDTTYQLVRIPIDSLKTADYSLNKVEILYFGTAPAGSKYKIYIDEIRVVKSVSLGAPVIGVSPDSLYFGNVQVGSSGRQTLVVSNTGNATLEVASVAVSGTDAGGFSASPTTFSVAAGQRQEVVVSFSPATAGNKVGTLSLTHNNPGHSPTLLSMSGKGTVPDIDLPVSALSFGTVTVGQSASQSLVIANSGQADLQVSGISSSSGAFAVWPAVLVVPAGGSGSVTVSFAPTAVGDASASLTISSNDPDENPISVALTGIGNEALFLWDGESGDVTAMKFYYGSANNTTPLEGPWCFEGVPDQWHAPGIGLNNLSSWRADLSGYDELWFYAKADAVGKTFSFSVYGWPYTSRKVDITPYMVGGGGLDTTYQLVRVPIDSLKTADYPLNKVEILYFGTAQPTAGHKIYLDEVQAVRLKAGSAVIPPVVQIPDISLAASSLSFGTVVVGQSASQSLVIANSGQADLQVSGISSSNGAFAVWPAALVVPAGGSGSVTVSFVPTAVGDASASLTISSNDPDESLAIVSLTGTGSAAPVATSLGPVEVTGTTSSSVDLSWGPVSGATEVQVYLSPEPAAVSNGPLPGQMLVATLGGDAATYRVSGLAAAVEVFLRVEAKTSQGSVAGNAHARTAGGPRAALDTPLRAVHGYAPNVLQVVLENKGTYYDGTALSGNTGSSWQAGPWTVTRQDGTPVRVNQVYRHSIPVGQPEYQVGYGLPYDDNAVDVDHRIYLVLDQAIGNREILRVKGPLALDFLLPFSDRYLETPAIQLNQVGYHPKATRRWAYVSGWMGNGGALSLGNFPATAAVLAESADAELPRTEVIGALPITLRSANDDDAGAEVRQIDLAAVPPAEGVRYRVRIPGVGVSWPTAVSAAAAAEAYYVVTRGLFHNRWGGDLQSRYTGWSRPADHPMVYTAEGTDPTQFYPESTPKTGERPLAGGYHDAGDFDQRPMHVAVAQLLLRAYELNPAAFADGGLNIPESGNGIPDLLDEALWGITGWEQLQESDGGVRSGVESYRHPWGYYHADTDPLTYWTYAREANHTARVAGLFAQAARLVAPYDAARANGLKTRAIDAYNYAVANGASSSNRLYAAGELFRLTGSSTYKSAFGAAWSAMGTYGAFSNFTTCQFYLGDYFNNKRAMPDFILGYLGASGADAGILSTANSWMTNYANGAVDAVLNSAHAHRNPRPAGRSVDWGNGTAMGRFMDTVYGRLQMGGLSATAVQDYLDALSLAADYALGANPDGLVYFTGLGSRRVEEALHLDALSFVKEAEGPIPGIPVYGPVEALPTASYYNPGRAAFYPAITAHPRMRRYGDLRTFVMTSEFTVWESQAPHAELFAVLQALAQKAAPKPATLSGASEEATASLGFGLAPNYPNPFNPSTTIRYRLSQKAEVRLAIYNLLGQQVRVLVAAPQEAGLHSAQWDGRDATGREVAPGMYLYRLEAGGKVDTRKMIFAK